MKYKCHPEQGTHSTAKNHISFLMEGSRQPRLECVTEEPSSCFTTALPTTIRITTTLIYTITKGSSYHFKAPHSSPTAKQLPFSLLQTLQVGVNPALQRLQFRSWFCILHKASVNTPETPNLINYICLGPSIHPAYC